MTPLIWWCLSYAQRPERCKVVRVTEQMILYRFMLPQFISSGVGGWPLVVAWWKEGFSHLLQPLCGCVTAAWPRPKLAANLRPHHLPYRLRSWLCRKSSNEISLSYVWWYEILSHPVHVVGVWLWILIIGGSASLRWNRIRCGRITGRLANEHGLCEESHSLGWEILISWPSLSFANSSTFDLFVI